MSSSCSSTVSDATSCGCWNTSPMRSRRSAAARSAARRARRRSRRPAASLGSVPGSSGALTTSGPTRTTPDVGGVSVAATASRLDLPAPDGPSSAVVVPEGTVRETSSTATRTPSPSG